MLELQKLIDGFSRLKIKEKNGKTFLEIIRASHIENIWSNILAFYFDPNNEHGFFDLFIKSAFQSIGINREFKNHKSVRIKTEYPTIKGNRIDIVIISNEFILGIENKVEAGLYNDLQDYSNTLKHLAKPQNLQVYSIVLSKYKIRTDNDFVNLTYSDFIKTIKTNIGDYTSFSDTKYLIFLLDFLTNIENNINANYMSANIEVINFFHKNIDNVNKLIQYSNKINATLIDKLNIIHSLVKPEEFKTEIEACIGGTIGGPGRFTWQGAQLIKYNVAVNNISFSYQLGISDYKIFYHYWFAEDRFAYLNAHLEDSGIREGNFEHEVQPDEIADKIKSDLIKIATFLNNYQPS